MATELIVRVPGKVMLCGEYFSLIGSSVAIAFALDTYLEVYVRYGTEMRQSLTLRSNLWEASQQVDADSDRESILVDSICQLMPAGEHRVEEIAVTSQLDPRHGFGSSSALYLSLSVIAFLQQRATNLIIPPAKRWQLAGRGFELQKKNQGLASGYDIATQFVGGVVNYHSEGGKWPYWGEARPFRDYDIEELHDNLTEVVHLFVGGQGADTAVVARDTMKWIDGQGHVPMVVASMELEYAFTNTLRDLTNLKRLIKAVAQWREWFSDSPHFPKHIESALRPVSWRDRKWSWKTSGAGGEDALIVVGYQKDIVSVTTCLVEQGWRPFDYDVAEQGMQLRRVKNK